MDHLLLHNTVMTSKTTPVIALHWRDWLLDGDFWLISIYAIVFDLLTDDSIYRNDAIIKCNANKIKSAKIFFVFYSVAIVGDS